MSTARQLVHPSTVYGERMVYLAWLRVNIERSQTIHRQAHAQLTTD
jgi:hypothetical protein